ncbi:hypothetical protein CPC08DRAFT_769829 [Agrocybe pediades]|nr:hypothetical protein CPC08DRAFT_769829 [Agrocybe pediades]
MANVLKYLASYGLEHDSSSIRQSLGDYAVDFIITYSSELRSCTIPPGLLEAAFSFPFKEFLVSALPWKYLYPDLGPFITVFLDILRIIVLQDPSCSYIEDHQHRNLEYVIIRQLQEYLTYNGPEAAPMVLALFRHPGTHRFVPWCNMPLTFQVLLLNRSVPPPALPFTRTIFDVEVSYDDDVDRLNLTSLWNGGGPGFPGEADCNYFDYMHRLLRSMSALSPTVYAKVAKACFDAFHLLRLPSFSWKCNAVADDVEDDYCP